MVWGAQDLGCQLLGVMWILGVRYRGSWILGARVIRAMVIRGSWF